MERDSDIARSAFDTVAAAQKAGTIAELNEVMAESMEALGFPGRVRRDRLETARVMGRRPLGRRNVPGHA